MADASDGISDEEIAIFEDFFGKAAFTDRLNIDQLKAEVPERIRQTKTLTSIPQRMQVMRDLCTVARA